LVIFFSFMSTLVIFNPISGAGRAKQLAEELVSEAEAQGLDLELMETSPAPPETWLREPLQGRRGLVVIGGDGAVRSAAAEAAIAGIPMIHMPAGNENLFAREFGMTADPEEVVRRLRFGQVRHLDLARGLVDGSPDEVIVLMASIGFDADVVHDLASNRSGPANHLSYLLPTLRSLIGFKPPVIQAIVDGEKVFGPGPAVVMVANSRQYAARLDPARRARMDDGLLDLVVMPTRGRWDLALWLVQLLRGRHLESPKLCYRAGSSIELRLEKPAVWQVDGDPPHHSRAVSTVSMEVVPDAFSVLVHPRTG
jgi:diacylglycerol kinase (ATP)